MPLVLSAALIAVPTALYAALVRSIDHFEKEPPKYLVAAFLWGMVPAALLALIAQLFLQVPTALLLGEAGAASIGAAIYAPITEEITKGLAVGILYARRRREFDGWVDGIVYGSTVGFGFAYIENILYLANTESLEEWVRLFLLRVIVFGFMHGFWTSLVGIGFGLARYARLSALKAVYIGGGFAAAIVAHAVHNGSLVLADLIGPQTLCATMLNYAVLIALMVGLRFVSRHHDHQMFRTYLADEVPHTLSPHAYAALTTFKRVSELPQPHRAFLQAAAELAQRKKQQLRHGEFVAPEELEHWRGVLRRFSYPHLFA